MLAAWRSSRVFLACLVLVTLPLLAACTFSSGGLSNAQAGGGRPAGHTSTAAVGATGSQSHKADRPNIVFISTDDERVSDMRWMPFTRRLIGGHGVTFTQALSPHPLCCPARAEFVTGQYGQNNGVHHNRGVYGGYRALLDPGNTLARWLHAAGYQTAMSGKYLNGYGSTGSTRAATLGWDHWNPSVGGVYSYNHTTFYDDGDRILQRRHVDDVVTSYVRSYIREFSKKQAPFYVWASDLAPHNRRTDKTGPPLPARRHRGLFPHVQNTAEKKASFGKSVVDGQRAVLHGRGLTTKQQTLFTARIRSLQAVDEGVQKIVQTLRETGELDNTYIIFTSDNGYLLGEHGLHGKNMLFEEALRVPMLVRLPGSGVASKSSVPVTSVDLAATVADLAGVDPGRTQDGQSFAPILSSHAGGWRDTQLVQTGYESHSVDNPGWEERGVRTARWTYGHNFQNGTYELFDRVADPLELVNLANQPGYADVLVELERRTAALESCAGQACRRDFGPDPAPSSSNKRRP